MKLQSSIETRNKSTRGFTLIELMITVAIVAILATLTIPSTINQRMSTQVAEAVHMADFIRAEVTHYYVTHLAFPVDNEEAGVPDADKLIGNKVTSIQIEDGAIHITLGNKVAKSLNGKTLTLRPAVVIDSPESPISWLCGNEKPVSGMEAVGINRTDVAVGTVPANCGS